MDLFPEIFAQKRSQRTGGGTTDVAAAIAKFSYGGIGTYAIALWTPAGAGQSLSPGDTVAGSALKRFNSGGSFKTGLNSTAATYTSFSDTKISLSLSGTWRALTFAGGSNSATSEGYLSLFVRIA